MVPFLRSAPRRSGLVIGVGLEILDDRIRSVVLTVRARRRHDERHAARRDAFERRAHVVHAA